MSGWIGVDRRKATCYYGCGRPAICLIGKKRRPCCSFRFTLCSEYRKRASERQRGSNNSFFGHKHSDDTIKRMSVSGLGEKNGFFGRRHSEEAIQTNRIKHVGKMTGADNPRYGNARSCDVRKKISVSRIRRGVARGERNPNWKGGVTPKRKTIMGTVKYREWRDAVFLRDDFTCQGCGTRGGCLHAHHVKPVIAYPELIFDVPNGETLCTSCHEKTYKESCMWRDGKKRRGGSCTAMEAT